MKIAILDDYQNVALQAADWSEVLASAEVTVFDRPIPMAEAAGALAPFDAICTIRERMPIPRALLEALPNLKLVCITGKYHRTLDARAAAERNICITYTESLGTDHRSTSELAWGLILALARHIPTEAEAMRKGGWQNSVGITLAGRTLGLVGLGRQGSYMVPTARALGMEVIAWSPNLTAEKAAQKGARRVEKEELFARSDVVSLHLVLSERSRGIVGAAELGLMKPTALLVNTARGPIVDEPSLVAALKEKRIAGAGLDVYDVEPLPDDHPLRTLPNAILMPHLGYNVWEFFQTAFGDVVANILAYRSGRPIRVLDPDRNASSP
ncbi:D-2-hydroxyacid dehydrogenase family protein [Rhizobiales bacterium L72]|uniref:D-2-hydroxyacid dehydrogenase family protein n=2 Tax=Propylenella binzhouense TaxID=2555902 RepID=A0A964T149_9HYPH|nr:D-2-hydroxyacid dehydrogenase family protein [Propylenella binzhouense]MYZ46441.1 D-2-hydroxyacid dehydrogenase family protein [Propylenella binzhouense]